MALDVTFVLILAATAADSLLAGASLDQSIKQLPARRRIGKHSSPSSGSCTGERTSFPFPGLGSASTSMQTSLRSTLS
jgi:hypothetical protein